MYGKTANAQYFILSVKNHLQQEYYALLYHAVLPFKMKLKNKQ